jgi:hypothetical protein
VVKYIADEVMVMYLGRAVEHGPREEVRPGGPAAVQPGQGGARGRAREHGLDRRRRPPGGPRRPGDLLGYSCRFRWRHDHLPVVPGRIAE